MVIVLLAILAGLLIPATRLARSQARTVLCRGNLAQWGAATHLYALEHEDFLPPEGVPNPTDRHTNVGWYIQLPGQIGVAPYHEQSWRTNARADPGPTVWLCPSNARRSNGRNLFHYCLNRHLDGTSEADEPVRLAALADPARLVWLFDSKNLPAVGSWNFTHTNLHQGGALFLFLDGHTARFPRETYWDAGTGRARTNHPELRWIP